MIEEHQSCKSYAPLHIPQDQDATITVSVEMGNLDIDIDVHLPERGTLF